MMPTKKRTFPEDRDIETYCWRYGVDATTAARHRRLRMVLNDVGQIPPITTLVQLLGERGVVVTPDTVKRDLIFFQRAHVEELVEGGCLDPDDADAALEQFPIPLD
jgi:hypothetical protein